MENTNKGDTLQTTDAVGLTETADPLNRMSVVTQYGIQEMKAKNWNFFVGGYKASKKSAQEALDNGASCVRAKWRNN